MVTTLEMEMVERLAVEELVAELPEEAREVLARGPAEDPICTACTALMHLLTSPWAGGGNTAADVLFDHHAGVDMLDVVPGFELCEGPVVFERCCDIYRAAGWDGTTPRKEFRG